MGYWIDHHLFTCPFKTITGWDCPGCGFQRSLVAFLKGDFHHSFQLYPAMFPILILFLLSIVPARFGFDKNGTIFKWTMIVTTITVFISYAIKVSSLRHQL